MMNCSPLKDSRRAQSANKYGRKPQFNDYSTPQKNNNFGNSGFGNSGFRTADKSSMGGSGFKSPQREEVEYQTANALREHLYMEKDLEKAKINLAIKPDFNIFDAFRIFDLNGNGYLTTSELKIGLQEIGVYAGYEEVDLFFKRYDTNRNGRVSFSEFASALLPTDPYYATMVNRRSSNSVYLRKYDPRDACF